VVCLLQKVEGSLPSLSTKEACGLEKPSFFFPLISPRGGLLKDINTWLCGTGGQGKHPQRVLVCLIANNDKITTNRQAGHVASPGHKGRRRRGSGSSLPAISIPRIPMRGGAGKRMKGRRK